MLLSDLSDKSRGAVLNLFFVKTIILLGSLKFSIHVWSQFPFFDVSFNFLLGMMKKKTIREISVNAAHVIKSPFAFPKSVLNLIFPRLNCCQVKNIFFVIFTELNVLL